MTKLHITLAASALSVFAVSAQALVMDPIPHVPNLWPEASSFEAPEEQSVTRLDLSTSADQSEALDTDR